MARNESTIQALMRSPLRRGLWMLSVAIAIQVSVFLWTTKLPGHHWVLLRRLRHAGRAHHLILGAVVLFAICVACVYLLSQMVLVKARVYNAKDPVIFRAREFRGFIEQDKNSE